ncbi:hypothetical protein J8I29_05215 [Labrys sp. LIt4]|uniref:Uncharacterized protein n=1 Tax=Labrys okinawensis TaxID=346911 RepID=A0A2S9QAQ5_9HYPH|nr:MULTISPECIES: hypothetical protein [Labrys]MBP0578698.1 hypothetical protein [Labrys sp. LIt4]PRH86433.1 hypothetical protein C5L14_13890 [Labrys okinawensis]
MLIASTEGQGWCYEVIAQSDGFLVQARDLDTGEVSLNEITLFRTSPVALAYADMAAAADRFAASRLEEVEDWQTLADDYHHELDRFTAIRDRLSDDGVGGALLRCSRAGSLRDQAYRLH